MVKNDVYIKSLTKSVDLYSMSQYYLIEDNDGFQSKHIIDDYTAFNNSELQQVLIRKHMQMREARPEYIHPGPSNEDLERYPALRHAWEEFLLVKRICGL